MNLPVCECLYWGKGTNNAEEVTCPDCLKWIKGEEK
jgi:hypothetical protein